jgi:predicted acetyltransferase
LTCPYERQLRLICAKRNEHIVKFRRAEVADAEELAEMNCHLIRDEGHRNRMNRAELEARMTQWLESEYEAFLFEEGEQTVGYALFRQETEYVYLRQFYIRPEHRRCGLGRAAIDWLWQHVWGRGRVRLEVLIGNAVAISFWRAVGFRDYCLTLERESEPALPSTSAPEAS